MARVVITRGPDVGPAGTIHVRCEEASWPIITGEGGPRDQHHSITPYIVEGHSGQGIPADPRLASWPQDLIEALRVIRVASEPVEYLAIYMLVTIPDRHTLSVAHMRLSDDVTDADYLTRLAAAYRDAGYEVESQS